MNGLRIFIGLREEVYERCLHEMGEGFPQIEVRGTIEHGGFLRAEEVGGKFFDGINGITELRRQEKLVRKKHTPMGTLAATGILEIVRRMGMGEDGAWLYSLRRF